jgi:PAS domain-containing protein
VSGATKRRIEHSIASCPNGKPGLAAIVESSDDAIVGKTLDGVIRSWNAGAHRVFGYETHEIIGRSVLVLIPPSCTMRRGRLSAGSRETSASIITGRGMPPDLLDSIFEPFVHGDRSLTRTVESAVGDGSTFTLVLPRRHVAP